MKTISNAVSVIFMPLLIPTYGMLLLMNMDIFTLLPFAWRAIAIGGTFLFTGLLPAIPIYFMIKRGEINDMFISNKEERTMPYLFSFLAYVFWGLFLWRTLQLPNFLISMGMASAISILALLAVNKKWKISAHTTSMGALVGSVFGVCFRLAINPVWLFVILLALSALVALARIELKAHTPAQTLAGFLLGFGLVLGASFLF